MKNYLLSTICFLSFLAIGYLGQAQSAFHRYSLSVGVTGGANRAVYSTRSGSDLSTLNRRELMPGVVDPFILEFGITNKFGIGFTSGLDYYIVDVSKFYGYAPINKSPELQVYSHYFTFDFNYHPYVTDRLDLSIFGSYGSLKINIADCPEQVNSLQNTANDASPTYRSYDAKGKILRAGTQARYYFWRRLGAIAMVSVTTGVANPQNSGEHSFGNNYSTVLTGFASEFGLCFRFF